MVYGIKLTQMTPDIALDEWPYNISEYLAFQVPWRCLGFSPVPYKRLWSNY